MNAMCIVAIFILWFCIVQGHLEATLSKCCQLGSDWAVQGSACAEFPSPVSDVAQEELAACLSAIEICCLNNYRQKYCQEGIARAKEGSECLIFNLFGGEFHKDCCEGCKLGMISASMGMGCTFSFGFPWDEAYRSCCTSTGDLCAMYPDDLCSHICVSTEGSFRCECHRGYQLEPDGKTCVQDDVPDRCAAINPCEQICVDTGVAIECSCRPGYSLNKNKRTCDDVDECEAHVHRCHAATQVCRNDRGSYACVNPDGSITKPKLQESRCPEGFRFNPIKQVCDDIDECEERTHECFVSSFKCINTVGSFTCSAQLDCPAGYHYSETDITCIDINECAEGLDDCNRDQQHCLNSEGSYFCQDKSSSSCPAGYKWNADSVTCEDVDECEEKLYVCAPLKETCRNTVGGYACDPRCPQGFTLNMAHGTCIDVDECKQEFADCNEGEDCVNLIGGYRCFKNGTCPPGFQIKEGYCDDIDECEDGIHSCSLDYESCVNTPGSFRCEAVCESGYGYNIKTRLCEDINECINGLHNCSSGTHCENEVGGFHCEDCPSGFQHNEETGACDDVDECAAGLHDCQPSQRCVNTHSSFYCAHKCDRGFRPSSDGCEDIDECRHNPCGREQECINMIGSYRCRTLCQLPGYETDENGNCVDTDECSVHDRCPSQHRCINTQGSFFCKVICESGFRQNSAGQCVDINECAENTDTCKRDLEACVNQRGGFICQCARGYQWNQQQRVCTDIDECSDGNDTCNTERETCKNVPGSYTCQVACSAGYAFIEDTGACEDVDECQEGQHLCEEGELCRNEEGYYRCVKDACAPGYRYDVDIEACTDVNECSARLHNCLPSQRCDNTIGSFTCVRITSCGTGYTLNAELERCEDNDECQLGQDDCERLGPQYECRNTQGSFRCDKKECPVDQWLTAQGICVDIECAQGFQPGADKKCVDVDECTSFPCRVTEKCTNTLGSFWCESLIRCSTGYKLNEEGTGCEDINECEDGSNQCGPKQTCINRHGSYSCQCETGYRLQSRTTCIDIDECSQYRQVCSINSVCENSEGSYRCICNEGFKHTSDGRQCRDVDECEQQPGICHQKCVNTWGTYQCTCNAGFVLSDNQRTCEDINECEEYRGRGNLCIGICVNEPGSFRCDCPRGYRLSPDGRVCKDIDECNEQEVCKAPNEVCLNIRGGHKCNTITCPPNYRRDTQHVNKCKRVSLLCNRNDVQCQHRPVSYSFNFITFTSNLAITPGAEIVLFTMRAPLYQSARVQFALTLKDVRAPAGVAPTGRSYFKLRRPATNLAIIALVRSIQGPQEIELELSMKLIYSNSFGGSAVARIFISVSQYEF